MPEHRRLALASLAALLGVVLLVTATSNRDPFRHVHQFTAALAGQTVVSDLTQNVLGARALLDDGDAYAKLHEQPYDDIPRRFDQSGSTHPPTSFLLALPLGLLPWTTAAAVWAWFTLVLYAAAGWLLGLSWPVAIAVLPLWMLWPPTGWAFGQWTALWLVGALLAWRWRDRPGLAGAVVAVISMTKLFPALLMFFLWRKRQSWVVFGGCWVLALALVAALNVGALVAYSDVREAGSVHVGRTDNGSPMLVAERFVGVAGAVAVVGFVIAVVAVAWRRDGVERWEGMLWGSVALLPLVWIYSLVPLVPMLLRRRSTVPLVALPFLMHPFSDDAGGPLLAVMLVGLGVALLSERSSTMAPHSVAPVAPS